MRYESTTFICDKCGIEESAEAGDTPPGWDCHGEDQDEDAWDICLKCAWPESRLRAARQKEQQHDPR